MTAEMLAKIESYIQPRKIEPVIIEGKPYYLFYIGNMKAALKRINILFSKKKIRGWKNKERIWRKKNG